MFVVAQFPTTVYVDKRNFCIQLGVISAPGYGHYAFGPYKVYGIKMIQGIRILKVLTLIIAGVISVVGALSIGMAMLSTDALRMSAVAAWGPNTLPSGYLDSGAEITPAMLDRYLPPPPRDAIPYEVREPLRNGETVPIKKRWLWTPPNQPIQGGYDPESGLLDVEVPVGAMWWKEFYFETSAGAYLIERRVMLKTPRGTGASGGWRFYTAHHLPLGADGITGNYQAIDSLLFEPESEAYFFMPQEWMPTVTKQAHTRVDFYDHTGKSFPYMFPGQSLCIRCHGGAAGGYYSNEVTYQLAFGMHPENITVESLRDFLEMGAYDRASFQPILHEEQAKAAESAYEEARLDEQTPEEAMEYQTRRLLDVFRNNCLSCHSGHSLADGRMAAMHLDPFYPYDTTELLDAMDESAKRAPKNPKPLVVPGNPEGSELYLRVAGKEGRIRMPFAEGGLPVQDEALVEQVRNWILSLGEHGY